MKLMLLTISRLLLLGLAQYHFFRTDTKNSEYLPIPISIRYITVFFKSVYNFISLLCFAHNLLNIDNFTVKKNDK